MARKKVPEMKNRLILGDDIVTRLNKYRAKFAPHLTRPAIVTEALIEYMDRHEMKARTEAIA